MGTTKRQRGNKKGENVCQRFPAALAREYQRNTQKRELQDEHDDDSLFAAVTSPRPPIGVLGYLSNDGSMSPLMFFESRFRHESFSFNSNPAEPGIDGWDLLFSCVDTVKLLMENDDSRSHRMQLVETATEKKQSPCALRRRALVQSFTLCYCTAVASLDNE